MVARFDPDTYDNYIGFARIGNGSLGGKARGLAFYEQYAAQVPLYDKYEGVRIYLPRTLVIATDCFDEFIRENGLQYVINSDISDDEILSEFVSSRLPESLVDDLRIFIRHSSKPLAVRSSSKLEDSHYQPFAGIYSTYMIPMTSNEDQTLRLLGKAIKSVYASVYFASSRALYPGDGQPAERGEDGRRDPGGVRDGRQRVFLSDDFRRGPFAEFLSDRRREAAGRYREPRVRARQAGCRRRSDAPAFSPRYPKTYCNFRRPNWR